jgi:hypothetical protein
VLTKNKFKKYHFRAFILKTIKRQFIYSSIEGSEVALVFERNNAGLKKLSNFYSHQTSDSSAILNAIYLSEYAHNYEQYISFIDPDKL